MSSQELRRVTFKFRGETDIRYLSEIPEVGDFVSHFDELWVVLKIEPDDLAVLVTCEQSPALRT